MAELIVSFPSYLFQNVGEAFRFTDAITHFEKSGITWSNRKGYIEYDPEKIITALEKEKQYQFTLIENTTWEDYGNTVTFRYNYANNFHIIFFSGSTFDYDDIISECTKKGFSFAYAADLWKAHWQNEKIIGNYKTIGRGKSHDHLPKKWDPVLSPIFKSEVIDIFYLPGHRVETYGISLMAAPEMWFGPDAWRFFDKNKISSFPKAKEIRVINPEVIYVKLFEVNAPDYETPEILELQKFFREYSGMNEIEKRQEAIAEENAKKDKTPPIQFLGDAARDHPMN